MLFNAFLLLALQALRDPLPGLQTQTKANLKVGERDLCPVFQLMLLALQALRATLLAGGLTGLQAPDNKRRAAAAEWAKPCRSAAALLACTACEITYT